MEKNHQHSEQEPTQAYRRPSVDAITGDKYLHTIETATKQTESAIIACLNRCARAINGEPLAEGKFINDKPVVFKEIDHDDPRASILVEFAQRTLNGLRDYYVGQSLHLLPKDRSEEAYRFLPNVTDIHVTDHSLEVTYNPNGVEQVIDISRLGIDFSIAINNVETEE